MPDLNKLKGIMVENGKTYIDGARVIGCSVTSCLLYTSPSPRD